jgi:hypothetical protein
VENADRSRAALDAAAARPAATAPPAAAAPPAVAESRHVRGRRVLLGCALVALALHSLAVGWNWYAWRAEPGAHGWMVITDFPVSLLYSHRTGSDLLAWSLLVGGLQWACTGALVAWAAWRIAGWRRRRR